MKTLSILLLTIFLVFNLKAQEKAGIEYDTSSKLSTLIAYQGYQGNTLSLNIGITKFCNYCDERNMKFFGLGIEAGSNIDQEKTIGARFTAERGKDLLGIRGTALVLTSDFEEYGFVVRPEIVLYPLRKQLFSIGVGFNFGRNFNRNKLHFGILALNAAYNFALKK